MKLSRFILVLAASLAGGPLFSSDPPTPDRAARIAEVHALLGDDMALVDRELRRMTREGVSPATSRRSSRACRDGP